MAARQDLPFLGPIVETRKPARVSVPAGSCDSHSHIIGPHSVYPLTGGRPGVRPPEALLDDYKRMLSAIGVERAVLVQPGVYGTDNRALLGAIATAPERMRGSISLSITSATWIPPAASTRRDSRHCCVS